MNIERSGDDFLLSYEKNYDTLPVWNKIETLVSDICNSAEMDFDISRDGVLDFSGIWLQNWNTDKEYLLTHKDVEDFYDGQPITLFGV